MSRTAGGSWRALVVSALCSVAVLAAGCGDEPTPMREDTGIPPGVDASIDAAGGLPGEDAGAACGPITSWSPSSIVVVPGQVLVLDADAPVDLGRTEALFEGGDALTLVSPDARSVGLVVPSLAPGAHVLNVSACGGRWSETFTVEAAPVVDDPDALIAEVTGSVESQLDALAAEPGIGEAPLAGMRALLEQWRTELAAMTPEERRAEAEMLAAHRALFERSSPMCREESCDLRLSCLFPRVHDFVLRLLAAAVVAVVNPLAGALAAALIIGWFANDNMDAVFGRCLQVLLNGLRVGDRTEALSGRLPGGAGGGELPLGTLRSDFGSVPANLPVPIVLAGEFAALGQVDVEGNDTTGEFVVATVRIRDVWTRIASIFSRFGQSLGFPVPEPGTETTADVISISNVDFELDAPPAGLSLSVLEAADGSLELTFHWSSTDPVEADVLVTYDNDGVQTFEQRMHVVVDVLACGDTFEACCVGSTPCVPPNTCLSGYCNLLRPGTPCDDAADCGDIRCGPEGVCTGSSRCLTSAHCRPVVTDPVTGELTGERCLDGLCVPADYGCLSDADCADENGDGTPDPTRVEMAQCDVPTGRCVVRPRCSGDGDCGPWGRCLGGACFQAGLWCDEDLDCCRQDDPGCGSRCFGGVCAATAPADTQSCAAASDCPLGRPCVGGGCQRFTQPGGACWLAEHCVDPGLCVRGVCRGYAPYGAPCESNAECGSVICAPNGRCDRGGYGHPCTSNAQCEMGLACRPDGRCGDGRPGEACTAGTDCMPHATAAGACVGGRCRTGTPDSPCTADEHCSPDLQCSRVGVCVSGDPGDPCDEDGDCDGGGGGGDGACGPDRICRRGNVGDPCEDDLDCPYTTGFTEPGFCGPRGCQRGWEGDYCADETDCIPSRPPEFEVVCRSGRCAMIYPSG